MSDSGQRSDQKLVTHSSSVDEIATNVSSTTASETTRRLKQAKHRTFKRHSCITASFLLLMQVLVEDIITTSVSADDSQQLVAISALTNHTEMMANQSEAHLNVTVMVYSGDERRVSNGRIDRAERVFTNSSLASALAISDSQLLETSLESNVNDKLEPKWDNEANETIDIAIASSDESNITSALVDKRLKPIGDNQAEGSIAFWTPMTGIVANKENWENGSTKLAANDDSQSKLNESYKSINTSGLLNRNSSSPTTTTPRSEYSHTSERSGQKLERLTIEEISDDSPQHRLIATQIESTLNSTASTITESLSPIDSTYSATLVSLTTPAFSSLSNSTSNASQLAIPTASSTLLESTEQTTRTTTPSGMDHTIHYSNSTHSSTNDTELDTDRSTTVAPVLATHPNVSLPSSTSQSESTVTTASLSTTATALANQTLLNGTVEYSDADETAEDDIDSVLPHIRCHSESLIDISWMQTDAGVLALQACSPPYSGSVYRACYSSGVWGNPDYTECRLDHLKEIQSLILYHAHKHLVDGLYPLAEDLSRLVTSGRFPIKSPMDRLDAIDALNAILRAKIKIRMEDEEKNVNLIQALITIKTAEALFGFRLLSENILRALIVSCDDGTIRRIKPIAPNSQNIIMTLTHRTSFGSLIPLVTPSNYTALIKRSQIPQVIIHLEDFNKLGVGISSVWIREIGTTLDNTNFRVISDIVLVSVVPAVSIEVDFEETPRVEVELRLKISAKASDSISCGRIKSPRDLWLKKGCETVRRNESTVHCVCDELGIIAALIQRPDPWHKSGHTHSAALHNFVFVASLVASLLLLVISLCCQIAQRSRESREASFILINLVSSLSAIQLTFLLVSPTAPLAGHSWLSRQICCLVPFVLHYMHLVSAFWMLSHTIFLYQRLWRPVSRHSSPPSTPFAESSPSLSPSAVSSRWPYWWSRAYGIAFCQWGCKQFAVFVTALPAGFVLASYLLNPLGYETKRYCWMSIEGGMLSSFIVPVFLLIMTNTVIMLLVLKRFFENKPLTHKLEIDKTQPALRAGVTLLPFFAVNWFLSVLALEDTATTAFQCIFATTNVVYSYLVFLFHCYQRYDLHEYVKVRVLGFSRKPKKSSLKLKKSHPGRALRVDIPRLCIGADRDVPIINRNSIADSQPLLMPRSSLSRTASYPPATGMA